MNCKNTSILQDHEYAKNYGRTPTKLGQAKLNQSHGNCCMRDIKLLLSIQEKLVSNIEM